MLLSTFAQAQRIKPSSRIEKASDSTYILLSDIDGKYQHTKLVAESGISFNISNDTIYISSTATGGGGGVTDITGGLGIKPDGSNTGSITLSFDPTEFGPLSTLDGNEEMWGYSSIVGQPVKYDIQGVFSNVLNDQSNGIDFSENAANQINVDIDLGELSLGTSFDGAFLLLGNYGTATERTIHFQDLLKNTLTSTDGSVTFTDNTFTLDLSASGGGSGTDDQTIDVFSFSSPILSLSLENDGEATKTVDLSGLTSGLMDNFNIQADGGASTSITDNGTINFDAGSNMTISRTGNTLLFESTGGGSGVSSVTGGTGLNPDAASTGAVTLDLDFSELTDLTTWDGDDYLAGRTTLGTEVEGTLEEIFGDMLKSSDASISISYDAITNNYDLTTSGGGGGTMDDFTIRGDNLSTQLVNDSYLLDVNGGNGLETRVTGGDLDILLDGDGLIDGVGSANGSYELWTFSGFINYRESIQDILSNSLTSTDGSVTIGTSGNDVNLTVTGIPEITTGSISGTTDGSGYFTFPNPYTSTATVQVTATGSGTYYYAVTGVTSTTVTVRSYLLSTGDTAPNSTYSIHYAIFE